MAKAKKNSDPSKPIEGRRQCGAMTVYERLCESEQGFRQAQDDIERETRSFVNSTSMRRAERLVYRIAVVVHCVYKKPEQKITLAQVNSQIKVLNADYRLKNSDRTHVPSVWKSLASDAGIEFYLATKDPAGAATNGLTFTQTTRDSFGTGDSVKRTTDGGKDPWDTEKYLNIGGE